MGMLFHYMKSKHQYTENKGLKKYFQTLVLHVALQNLSYTFVITHWMLATVSPRFVEGNTTPVALLVRQTRSLAAS
jgi:hypothetical protein